MKALKISELNNFTDQLQTLVGSELQDIFVSKRDVVFLFFVSGERRFLWLDFFPQCPVALLLRKMPISFKKVKTPMELFVKANLKGGFVTGVSRNTKYGRVLEIEMEDHKGIEIRLFPHGQNLIVKSGEKSLSLNKPKALEEVDFQESSDKEGRSFEEIVSQWLEVRGQSQGKEKPLELSGFSKEKQLKKVRKSRNKLAEDMEKKQSQQWEEAAQFLNSHQKFPDKESPLWRHLDNSLSLQENIQRCFEQHKKNREKIFSGLSRLEDLDKELARLESLSDEAFKAQAKLAPKAQRKLDSNFKSRKLTLKNGQDFYVGKSAKDNLGLLRKAKAWDLWFHIKDIPSAHGILFRNKGPHPDQKVLEEAAQFLIAQHAGKNTQFTSGEAFQVLYTETRYVRPIKGDKLGRVTHQKTQIISVIFKG